MAIIEEPERNLHPALISRLMSMMRDVSKEKQLLITTHSPEVIRNSEIEDILFISRGENGFSSIRRPAETEDVRRFLNEELGMDDLYVQNLLS
jgi:predicted ATPase